MNRLSVRVNDVLLVPAAHITCMSLVESRLAAEALDPPILVPIGCTVPHRPSSNVRAFVMTLDPLTSFQLTPPRPPLIATEVELTLATLDISCAPDQDVPSKV